MNVLVIAESDSVVQHALIPDSELTMFNLDEIDGRDAQSYYFGDRIRDQIE